MVKTKKSKTYTGQKDKKATEAKANEKAVGKVAVMEAVAENKGNGYGNRLNSISFCGARALRKRTMTVTNVGRSKRTKGRPALQPRNKEKILAKEKTRATEKGKTKATEKAKATERKVAKSNPAKDNQAKLHRQPTQFPRLSPLKEERDQAIEREGGSTSCKRTLPTWPNRVDLR